MLNEKESMEMKSFAMIFFFIAFVVPLHLADDVVPLPYFHDVLFHSQRYLNMRSECFDTSTRRRNCRKICLPAFLILGIAKGGTSALFKFICKHPNVVCGKKELGTLSPDKALGKFPSCKLKHNDITGAMWRPAENTMQFLRQSQGGLKGILIFRKPDEWIYSAYNFWCHSLLEKHCSRGGWVTNTMNRSPEHFHSVLTEMCVNLTMRYMPAQCPLRAPYSYVKIYRKWATQLGKENLFVTTTERLFADGLGVLSDIFEFLQLSPFGNKSTFLEAVNVNSHKGVNALSDHDKGLGGTIKPMLPVSRRILQRKIDYYNFIKELSELTGLNLSEWW
mmetsp:Transcript_20866/g.58695  ORF Transcript_20866/g.58695 Transcript_20866/m.58695 type:complete len:334 (+) Transcript_20866:286-1287(+)